MSQDGNKESLRYLVALLWRVVRVRPMGAKEKVAVELRKSKISQTSQTRVNALISEAYLTGNTLRTIVILLLTENERKPGLNMKYQKNCSRGKFGGALLS